MTGKINHSTHGMSGSPVYHVWQAMKQRCHNPAHASWKYYGERGIRVCERWRESFEAFYADLGEPEPGLTIERIDNDGDYEPGNVRWATRGEQAVNRGEYHCSCCRMGRMFRIEPGTGT